MFSETIDFLGVDLLLVEAIYQTLIIQNFLNLLPANKCFLLCLVTSISEHASFFLPRRGLANIMAEAHIALRKKSELNELTLGLAQQTLS